MMHVFEICPGIILLSVVSKMFENLVNDKLIYHLMKSVYFSDSQYGVRLFHSAVVAYKIDRAFNISGVALDLLKTFDTALHYCLQSYHFFYVFIHYL